MEAGSVSDECLRELERRWKESGTDEDAERFLQEKVRQGLPVIEVLKLTLSIALGYRPEPSEVLAWLETGALPCSENDCTNPSLATFEFQERRICSSCWEAGKLRGPVGGHEFSSRVELEYVRQDDRRRCYRDECNAPLLPGQQSIYCSNGCVHGETHERREDS